MILRHRAFNSKSVCRWGNTPMDEAVHFGHHDVVTILRDYHTQYSPPDQATEKQDVEKNLDGML